MDEPNSPHWRMQPLPVASVRIDDAFWSPRTRTNREVSIPHNLQEIRRTGRLANFLKAAGKMPGEFEGIFFNDSDVYKWVEAAAFSLATNPDPKLEADLDEVIAAIAAAQQPDGYLNTYYTLCEPGNRWTSLRHRHELYCAGHLIEAGVAHHQATGRRTLLDVAIRLADCIDGVFGPTEQGKRRGCPGHEEIELALVKLFRATGKRRYLQLAQFFIDVRGTEPNVFTAEVTDPNEKFDPSVYQAHKPVREQTEVVGHAVRAMYLYSAMADLFAETGDRSLLNALERLWVSLVSRRMYITGGIGSTARHEGFTSDYDLPNESAYAETCASIGSVLWNHRMLNVAGEARFADVMELALYNGVLAGAGLDGATYFYVNPLRSRGGIARVPWFGCACCPPNVARLLASLGGYIYSQSDDALWVHLFIGSTAKTTVGGQDVTITQETRYPWSGGVRLTIDAAAPVRFGLNVRIPGWCAKTAITVNATKARFTRENGYACIRRTWAAGDTVDVSLQMDAVLMEANPHVEADFGKAAIMRGPLVYCLEEAENGRDLFAITLPKRAELSTEFREDLLGGVAAVTAPALAADDAGWADALYRSRRKPGETPRTVTAIPYCCWANRGAGEMIVWMNAR